jgi:hypothetical protein
VDPKLPAEKITPLWRPEFVPTAVILTHAPAGFANAVSLDPALLATAIAQSDRVDGLHLRLPGDHQLWLPDKNPDQPLAVVIPLDDDLPLRAAGAVRLHHMLKANKASPVPQSQVLTAQQRQRLIQMLVALDGRCSQASYREIASVLFGDSATSEKGWKTHPIRARTIRLVNDAMKMVNRGYLKLLRGR